MTSEKMVRLLPKVRGACFFLAALEIACILTAVVFTADIGYLCVLWAPCVTIVFGLSTREVQRANELEVKSRK